MKIQVQPTQTQVTQDDYGTWLINDICPQNEDLAPDLLDTVQTFYNAEHKQIVLCYISYDFLPDDLELLWDRNKVFFASLVDGYKDTKHLGEVDVQKILEGETIPETEQYYTFPVMHYQSAEYDILILEGDNPTEEYPDWRYIEQNYAVFKEYGGVVFVNKNEYPNKEAAKQKAQERLAEWTHLINKEVYMATVEFIDEETGEFVDADHKYEILGTHQAVEALNALIDQTLEITE